MKAAFNRDLVHQVVRTKMLNKRRPIASTKDRAQVAGGGKKPWPQKGTGRARAGSNRSPIWKGGGITFGPNAMRHYAGKVTKKMNKAAFSMVLAKKQEDKEVISCESIDLKEAKTKQFKTWLRSVVKEGSALVVGDENMKIIKRAGRNMADVKVVEGKNLGILDILNHKYMVITKPALIALQKRLATKQ